MVCEIKHIIMYFKISLCYCFYSNSSFRHLINHEFTPRWHHYFVLLFQEHLFPLNLLTPSPPLSYPSVVLLCTYICTCIDIKLTNHQKYLYSSSCYPPTSNYSFFFSQTFHNKCIYWYPNINIKGKPGKV